MLEAVNSVISNASLLRGQSEQQSQSRALATNPDSVQVVPQAPYISPYIRIDSNYNTAVLVIRDRDTGDTLTTIQSDASLQARADAAARSRADILGTDTPAPQQQAAQVQTQAPAAQAQQAIAAFARQVSSMQAALSGGGTGATVSTFA